MLVRSIVSLFALVVLAVPSAHAAPILFPSTGVINGTVVIPLADPTAVVYDVRGAAQVSVIEQSTLAPIGTANLFGSDPFPSDQLTLANLGSTEFLDFTFDFSTSTFSPTFNEWNLSVVTGTPLTALTDPALIGFTGHNVAQFLIAGEGTFIFDNEQNPFALVVPYALNFILSTQPDNPAVPEPATIGLVATGLAVAARRRRKLRTNTAD
ncbi:MAG TPA: PEP-CTERM sorting domain-containing protein [Vicinamibacterales bacterium]|nr:PEP-CTERM sorting domain-containing protein [Vicinamibacterales bacterium]